MIDGHGQLNKEAGRICRFRRIAAHIQRNRNVFGRTCEQIDNTEVAAIGVQVSRRNAVCRKGIGIKLIIGGDFIRRATIRFSWSTRVFIRRINIFISSGNRKTAQGFGEN